ncbi:trypsin-like serine protease [Poriferisphaera sp. WC338]|uniref:trypsin-like serine protease n=1 Tax=Poriferisphaera sp. WC338 TaxID=3425129 RepID=UPI003D814191
MKKLLCMGIIGAFAAPMFATSSADAVTMRDLAYDYWHKKMGEKRKGVPLIITDQGVGSGVLIGNEWVLTAGHVVGDATSVTVAFDNPNSGVQIAADSWHMPSTYDPTNHDVNLHDPANQIINMSDVALIRLATPVENRPIYEVNRRGAGYVDSIGRVIEQVGWGSYGDGATGSVFPAAEDRRVSFNRVEDASRDALVTAYGDTMLVTRFNVDATDDVWGPISYAYTEALTDDGWDWEKDGAIVFEALIAGGDSGGPDFLGDKVVGIHSFGTTGSPFLGHAASVNIAMWADWIDAVMLDPATASVDIDYRNDGSVISTGVGTLLGTLNNAVFTENEMNALYQAAVTETLAAWDAAGIDYSGFNPPTDTGFFLGRGALPTLPVPEPGTLVLLGSAGLMLLRRKHA